MKKKLLSIILSLFIFLAIPNFSGLAQSPVTQYIVNLYFFRGEGCPHCAQEEVFLQQMTAKYGDQLVIHEYEVWYHPENVTLLEKFAEKYGFEPSGVPVTFIGNQYWVGFNDIKQQEIETAISSGIQNGVVDTQDIVDGKTELIPPEKALSAKITIPLIGQVDLAQETLFVSTVIIGLVDGVNPCSLWVLTMLLAMLVHTNSRKKMTIIGLVFIIVAALIYALFITGVFTLLTYASYLKWIQIVVAAITLVLGLINLKDYFFFKEGVSLTIADEKKPGIYQKMRNVVNNSENLWAMIGATIVLALGVSLVEFSCTAAFPVVWSNLLVANHASKATFIALLILYLFLYQLDELVIFTITVISMKSSRMQETHGQILKLFSGCLMVSLSLVMLIDPTLMNNLSSSLLVFGVAILITAIIYLVTDKILPRYGIRIGHTRKSDPVKGKPVRKKSK